MGEFADSNAWDCVSHVSACGIMSYLVISNDIITHDMQLYLICHTLLHDTVKTVLKRDTKVEF